MSIPRLCPRCGFLARTLPAPGGQGADCNCCGAHFDPSHAHGGVLAALPAVAAPTFLLVSGPGGQGASWPGWAPMVLMALPGSALIAFAGLLFMRRAVVRWPGRSALPAACLAGLALAALAGGLAGLWRGVPVWTAGLAAAVAALPAMAAGWAAFQSLSLPGQRQRGGFAPPSAAWAAAWAGLLTCWLGAGLFPAEGVAVWAAQLAAIPLVSGLALGYRCSARPAAQARGQDRRILDGLVEQLCRRGGLRRQSFMAGRLLAAARDSGLPLTEFSRRAQSDSAFADRALAELAWGTTYFFREDQSLDRLLGLLQGRDGPVTIKVPGCSTGEEAYSVAMLAMEAGVTQVRVLAGDISQPSLAFATRGIYDPRAFSRRRRRRRSSPPSLPAILEYPRRNACRVRPEILAKYFQPTGDGRFAVGPQLRNVVELAPCNVVQDRDYAGVDVIVFRNVITHLAPEDVGKVLGAMADGCPDGAVLVLSKSDLKALPPAARRTLDERFQCPWDASQTPVFLKRADK